ncbi:hypothetical protein [Flavobacterium sp.]|uniref:hypothetical protein n=1 Tax=Flavobacterium sp. TaxID=239 RepID=UPI003BDE7168
MIINKITDLSQANEIIINRLSINTQALLPLDQLTYDCIVNNRFDFLRQIDSNYTYDEHYATYVTQHGELPYVEIMSQPYSDFNNHVCLTESSDTPILVYPFSKNQLFKNFYSDLIPSVTSLYFNYMRMTERIMQIGSGVGKCLLIKLIQFTEEDFINIQNLDVSYSDLANLLVRATDHLAKQECDITFLGDAIKEYENQLLLMQNKIVKLESQLINSTTYTWR